MKSKMREALGEAKRILKKISPLLLSHHPVCSGFGPDMIKMGDRYFCKGCFIGYTFAALLILTYLLLDSTIGVNIDIHPGIIIIAGIVLGSTQFVRAIFIDLPSAAKTVQKLMLGSGIALVTIGVLRLQVGIGIKVLIFVILVSVYGILGFLLRIIYIKRTCKRCEFRENWEICDGLSFLYKD